MAIAWLVFRENVDRRLFLGAMAILAGAVLLSWPRGGIASPELNWGSVLIILACVAWGIDNNLTRKLGAADPLQIAMIKGLVAGIAVRKQPKGYNLLSRHSAMPASADPADRGAGGDARRSGGRHHRAPPLPRPILCPPQS
jgi:hypothetical protein